MIKQFHDVIEEAPNYCERIADLANLSTNYDYQQGTPFWAFLDLIGYSAEHLDDTMNPAGFVLDYASVDAFTGALQEWSVRPADCLAYIDELWAAD